MHNVHNVHRAGARLALRAGGLGFQGSPDARDRGRHAWRLALRAGGLGFPGSPDAGGKVAILGAGRFARWSRVGVVNLGDDADRDPRSVARQDLHQDSHVGQCWLLAADHIAKTPGGFRPCVILDGPVISQFVE